MVIKTVDILISFSATICSDCTTKHITATFFIANIGENSKTIKRGKKNNNIDLNCPIDPIGVTLSNAESLYKISSIVE